ncbi:MAG TPA: cupin domain-containing protein [Gaiellaceae bacterium]
MSDDNIWTDEWDEGEDWSGGGAKAKRLPRGEKLGATVYELGPGNFCVYHFHHASEEMLFVLDGEMTLKTDRGERLVRRGEVVVFPVGPAGAHGFRNDGDETCRYLMASSRHREMPEVCEYPELGQITAQAPTASQTGERLWFIYDVPQDG